MALPKNTNIDSSNIIWVSGLETWKNIAKRGIWVNGSSDGLGEDIDSNIQHLTQNEWIKLTHRAVSYTHLTLPTNREV